MPNTIKHTFIGWITFSILLSAALLVSGYIYSAENIMAALDAEVLFRFWIVRAILILTGFIVYGFMKVLFANWFRQKNRVNVMLILVFYILILGSYLLTYLMAENKMDTTVLIDAPLMIAVVTLLMGIIPYFKNHLFSATID